MIDPIEYISDEEIEQEDLMTERQWLEAGFFKKWNIRSNIRNSAGELILSREQVESLEDIEAETEDREYDAMNCNWELHHEY